MADQKAEQNADQKNSPENQHGLSRREFLQFAAGASVTAGSLAVPQNAFAKNPDRPGPGIQWKLPPLSVNPTNIPSGKIFDYLIIGSGYGGSVNAARIAQKYAAEIKAGTISVAVLERGKEWIPGTFPQTFGATAGEVTDLNHHLGLLDFHFNEEYDALVGQGLGGGSLINGNVVIEPDEELFDEKLPTGEYRWPEEIRSEYKSGQFGAYFDRVRLTLDAQVLPHGPSDTVPKKSTLLERDTEALGGKFTYLNIAVNFKPDGTTNIAGVPRNKCRLCGDCITGCNWGAKQTLYMNYLPLAKQSGAEIYTQVKVMGITKRGDHDYAIHITKTPNARQQKATVDDVIYAKNVIVSAGTLGSTELLLRSQVAEFGNLPASPIVGNRFSANADSLGMSYNTNDVADSVAFGTRGAPRSEWIAGTCMEAMDDGRFFKNASGEYEKRPLRERYLIQHGVMPSAIAPLVARLLVFVKMNKASLKDVIRMERNGGLNRSMIYLGMGHDDADGTAELKKGKIFVRWPGVQNEESLVGIRSRMIDHADQNGGRFTVPNPLQNLAKHRMTVHPLGGCVMGSTRNTGVVNHRGQVFDVSQADPTAVHAGLYVADGSIVPDSLGVNPLLTISALSERISDFITGVRT